MKRLKKEKIEMIPVNTGEKEAKNVEKSKLKKLNLNTVKYILNYINNHKSFKVIFGTGKEILTDGLIISLLLFTILDITVGYKYSFKTILHIFGCGAGYHLLDDIIGKLKQ